MRNGGIGRAPGTRAKLFNLNAPRTSTATDVAAAFTGHSATVDPTDLALSLTQPDIPRNIVATFGATWSNTNNVKVYGTDAFGNSISEVLAGNQGSTRTGALAFATITKVTKSANFDDLAGNAANTCSLGTGKVFGVSEQLADTFTIAQLVGTGFETVTVSTTNNTFTPATAPNGSRVWEILANIS